MGDPKTYSDNPNRYDICDVQSAAKKLVAGASGVAVRQLKSSKLKTLFGRDVGHYAKRILDEVANGTKTPEQGMQALLKENNSLSEQTRRLRAGVATPRQTPSAHELLRDAQRGLTQPASRPDPLRLQRYIEAQKVSTAHNPAGMGQGLTPSDPFLFYTREQWPAEVEYFDPGFYIVPKSTTAEALQAELFDAPTPVVLAKFKALNPALSVIKAGEMIVLSDPANPRCTREEAQLMATASEVKDALKDLTPEEADFMARHRAEIESFLTHGSAAVGIGEAVFAKHLEAIKQLMQRIENLHMATLAKDGHLRSSEFFAERKRLMTQLDKHLAPLVKKGIGFPDHPKLKTALGISSRSLVHRYGRAGGRGQNPGHATHLAGVAKAAKYVKYGGWIGTTLGAGASVLKVQKVCAAGDAEACEKVKYTEAGGFLGSVIGGSVTATALRSAAIPACVALGAPTAGMGTIACGLVVIGIGTVAAGFVSGKLGEAGGEVIYRVSR